MNLESFYACNCFLNKNYFVEKFNLHLEYNGEPYLSSDIKQLLLHRHATETDLDDVLGVLTAERNRRINLGAESLKRKLLIKQKYSALHPYLYSLQNLHFTEKFLSIVDYAKLPNASKDILVSKLETTSCKHVWRFPVFTDKFCDAFIEELENFQKSDLPKGRPNTMNHYGFLLNELGFDEYFFDDFRYNYLSPIAKLLFPDWYGEGLDSHKVFTVCYKQRQDVALSYHFDNAEISLNVCLGKQFEEGELYFGGMNKEPSSGFSNVKKVQHKKGYGILHRGQHMHGAMPITGDDSERYNLIMWMRSSSVRNKLCPMCGESPSLIEQSYGGDGFSIRAETRCGVA